MVRPDNSECMRKLGARGNMCLLHISPGGVTLVLEVKYVYRIKFLLTEVGNILLCKVIYPSLVII